MVLVTIAHKLTNSNTTNGNTTTNGFSYYNW